MSNSDYSNPNELFEPGKLLVQFKTHDAFKDRMNAHTEIGATVIQQIPELNIDIVTVEPGNEMEYMSKYLSNDQVNFVEPNYYLSIDYKPNDPFYSKKTQTSQGLQRQWGLRRINPEPAWDIVHNLSPSVKIAILDSGIDPNHPDLKDKIVDPINLSTSDPTDYIDRTGHGTFIAGIAAAATNNKTGIAGTSFNTSYIMPIRVGDTIIYLSTVINGIIYAINNGAKVINMSLGMYSYSVSLQSAVEYAWNNGIVCVAAAGNEGRDQLRYPAGNNYVLAVSATGKSNSLTDFSNWGFDIGVTAPGEEILSTTPTYPHTLGYLLYYDVGLGTSYAAPFFSGVAAMMFAVNPSLTNKEVVQIIEQTASSIDDEDFDYCFDDEYKRWNPFFGYGLLNAGKAVKKAKRCCCSCRNKYGSFYGQVIDKQTELPIANAVVYAYRKRKLIKQYITKTNVPTINTDLSTDGMFRLMNLWKGTYDICVGLPDQPVKQVAIAKIVPGADTFLRLLVETNTQEDILLKNRKYES